MTTLDELLVKLRDEGHMTQRDGLAALLETATQAADALEAAARENERLEAALAAIRDFPHPSPPQSFNRERGMEHIARNALSGGPQNDTGFPYGLGLSSKALLHTYRPHPKYPWFCEECGYPEHESLKHQATAPTPEESSHE